jgi:hypothetical protein
VSPPAEPGAYPLSQGEMLSDPQARQDLLACLAEERGSIQAAKISWTMRLGPFGPQERPSARMPSSKDIQDTLSVRVTHLGPRLVLLHR